MNKELYKELLRLRKQEESYVISMCKWGKERYELTPRQMFEFGFKEGMSHKRFIYLLNKFSDQGLYDYGVNIELGWFK